MFLRQFYSCVATASTFRHNRIYMKGKALGPHSPWSVVTQSRVSTWCRTLAASSASSFLDRDRRSFLTGAATRWPAPSPLSAPDTRVPSRGTKTTKTQVNFHSNKRKSLIPLSKFKACVDWNSTCFFYPVIKKWMSS